MGKATLVSVHVQDFGRGGNEDQKVERRAAAESAENVLEAAGTRRGVFLVGANAP